MSLTAEKGTQVLRVSVIVAPGAVDGVTALRERLVSKILPELNAAGGHVGVAYFEVRDRAGELIVFEVADSVAGWGNVYSQLGSP